MSDTMAIIKSFLDATAISIAFVFVMNVFGFSGSGALGPAGFLAVMLAFFLELLGIRL